MRASRRWGVVLVLVAAATAALPAVLGDAALTDVAVAVTRAAAAAGAAVAVAAGRPSLAVAGVAGAGAYCSALAALHGWPVPLAVVAGVGFAAVGSAALGLVGARLGGAGFVALTLVATLAGGALVAAVPGVFGGSAGLTSVPPLSWPLRAGDTLALNAMGTLHACLVLCAVAALGAALLLDALPGARWRAIGGDRERSAAAGLRPLRGELGALACAGGLAGLGGALGVHAAGVASPSAFSVDAAAMPLLAALLARRGGPALAALIGGATAVLGLRVLPALGWSGPPGGEALATGVLAAATLLALPVLLGRVRGRCAAVSAGAEPRAAAPWPGAAPRGGPAGLRLRGLEVVAGPGAPVVARLDLDVAPGAVHGLAGPNGAGKSTALRTVAAVSGAVLMPQAGGGWPGTTVSETLRLAARAGGRSRREARSAAAAWMAHLGLGAVAGAPCETLAHGTRRRVELARVLLLRPAVLLCDEPLAGLDPADRALVLTCLRAAAGDGTTLLVAEHDRASLASLASSTTELSRLDLTAAVPAVDGGLA